MKRILIGLAIAASLSACSGQDNSCAGMLAKGRDCNGILIPAGEWGHPDYVAPRTSGSDWDEDMDEYESNGDSCMYGCDDFSTPMG